MFVYSNNTYIFVKQKRGRNRVKGANSKMQVANTILQQLGGRKFTAMTGSKNFLYAEVSETVKEPWLRMDLTTNKAGVNRLKITLNSNDTYTMEFYKMTLGKATNWEAKITRQQTFENVYDDMLQAIFTQVTGLYTSL